MSNVWVKLSEIEERLQTVVTMTSSMCGTSIDAVTPAVDVVLLAVICTRAVVRRVTSYHSELCTRVSDLTV